MEKQIPYGLKTTFLVHFVAAVVFGLVFLLIPEMFGGMKGSVSIRLYRGLLNGDGIDFNLIQEQHRVLLRSPSSCE